MPSTQANTWIVISKEGSVIWDKESIITFKLFCSHFFVFLFLAWDRAVGRVGPPICSSEIKLVSWEEG